MPKGYALAGLTQLFDAMIGSELGNDGSSGRLIVGLRLLLCVRLFGFCGSFNL